MRRLLVAVLAVALFAMPCLASDRYETVANGGKPTYYPQVPGPVFDGGRDILYENGDFETAPGISELQTALGMGTYGWGHQTSAGNIIADDFEIGTGHTWEIHDITFFAYQSYAAPGPSTISAVYLTIWDGSPDLPGSNIIWGDMSVNAMTGSISTGIYRVLDTDVPPLPTGRLIMASTCHVGITLTPGTYWLVWQSDGDAAYSGPWAPPITTLGQTVTGNGLQSVAGVWSPVYDFDVTWTQGFPFIIEGVHPSPVEESTWTSVKAMFR